MADPGQGTHPLIQRLEIESSEGLRRRQGLRRGHPGGDPDRL